jgi:hypothetical protein
VCASHSEYGGWVIYVCVVEVGRCFQKGESMYVCVTMRSAVEKVHTVSKDISYSDCPRFSIEDNESTIQKILVPPEGQCMYTS